MTANSVKPPDLVKPDGWIDNAMGLFKDKIFIILDMALVITAILMMMPQSLILFFHTMYLLLIVGAFYWDLRAFTTRAVVWVTVISVILITTVAIGHTAAEEIIELPLMTAMLLFVFFIARRRAKAEESLRAVNEELETRVNARTAQLTVVNAELTHEIEQRREAETVLRESEDRYRRLVELSFEVVAIHSAGKIISINSNGLKLFGASSSNQIVGQPLLKFVHSDYVETVQNRVQDQISNPDKGVPLIEEKFICLDGTVIDVEVAAVPITIHGKSAIQTVVRDITPRKRAEAEREKLLATERQQRILAETLGDIFLALAAQTSRPDVLDEILRQANRIVSHSAANIVLLQHNTLVVAHHHGYKSRNGEAIMANLQQSLADYSLDREVVQSKQAVVVSNTYEHPLWVTTPENTWVRSFIAVPISLGSVVIGLLRLDGDTPHKFSASDVERLQPLANAAAIVLENARLYDQARQEIVERKQAEDALRLAWAKNQAVLNAISDSIFEVGRDGHVLDHNIQQNSPLTWAQEIAQGKNTLQEIFPAEFAVLALNHISLALNTNSKQIFEFELTQADSVRNLECRLMPVAEDKALLLLADLTDYKNAQLALNKERARIARDLHDSLGQSLGYLRLKLDQFSLDGYSIDNQLRPELLKMRDVTNEAYEIVRSMLAAARPSNSMALQSVLLAQAQGVGSRARFKVSLKTTGHPRPLPPIVQQQALFICQEALSNIEKHAQAKTVNISLNWGNTTLIIKMVDDGEGFSTTTPAEPGHYGLSIMQERATEIGGNLSITSAYGRGTELKLTVPVVPAE